MGKRGNENSQMSKEDCDAAQRQKDGLDDATGGQMQRASEDAMKQRRIIRAKKVTALNETNSNPTGIFAGINLTAGASSRTPAFSFATNAAPIPPASSGFSFTGGTTAATTTTIMPGDFTFGATKPSQPAASALTTEMERLEKEREQELLNSHANFISSTDVCDKEQIIHSMIRNIRKWKKTIWKAEPTIAASKTNSFTAPPLAAAMSPVPVVASANTASTTSSATASGGFSFSFGAAPTPASATKSSTPSSGGFSFRAASTPTTPSALTSPAADDGEPSDEIPKRQTDAVVQEVADPDWDNIANIEPVTIYRFEKGDKGGWKPLVSKTRLRLQTSKTDASQHRMIARDLMGKPVVNMSIQSGMGFKLVEQTSKKGPFATLLFVGTNDAARGAEKFNIKTHVAVGKQLQQKLDELCPK